MRNTGNDDDDVESDHSRLIKSSTFRQLVFFLTYPITMSRTVDDGHFVELSAINRDGGHGDFVGTKKRRLNDIEKKERN